MTSKNSIKSRVQPDLLITLHPLENKLDPNHTWLERQMWLEGNADLSCTRWGWLWGVPSSLLLLLPAQLLLCQLREDFCLQQHDTPERLSFFTAALHQHSQARKPMEGQEQQSCVTAGMWWLLHIRGKELAPKAAGFMFNFWNQQDLPGGYVPTEQ